MVRVYIKSGMQKRVVRVKTENMVLITRCMIAREKMIIQKFSVFINQTHVGDFGVKKSATVRWFRDRNYALDALKYNNLIRHV